MAGCGGWSRPTRVESSSKQLSTPAATNDHESLQHEQAESETSSLVLVEVEISGFQNQEGKCRLAAYDSRSSFQDPELAVARSVIPIDGDSVRWSFQWNREGDAPGPGQLAISAHHDRNENGELDKNLVGMPTEPYGFSNNPKRGYGPPKFEQVVVTRPDDALLSSPWQIEITIK
jgi:uncharacterized protein (DUF2141 family)